ncbi:MAG: transglycosylase SLT domain-containing protein [Dechloromonas sp.]|nr:transglycosylase SLT domain-containing protein [Dechloromonas sp.]
MVATTTLSPVMLRVAADISRLIRKFLMFAGLLAVLALVGAYSGHVDLLRTLQGFLPSDVAASEANLTLSEGDDALQATALDDAATISPRMHRALRYVSQRYRVSNEALRPIFATAQESARALGIDPLLIIAVIGIESGFNPFSQSVVGAQGLMQVMPRFHADKLPEDAGELPFFDPVTNVQVGARVLKESIRRNGGLVPGLQQFGGAINDPARRYSSKVLAERQRLEQAVQKMQKA